MATRTSLAQRSTAKLASIASRRAFFEPTIVADATPDMLIFTEETFGPVAPAFRFKTEKEVIQRTRPRLAPPSNTFSLYRRLVSTSPTLNWENLMDSQRHFRNATSKLYKI